MGVSDQFCDSAHCGDGVDCKRITHSSNPVARQTMQRPLRGVAVAGRGEPIPRTRGLCQAPQHPPRAARVGRRGAANRLSWISREAAQQPWRAVLVTSRDPAVVVGLRAGQPPQFPQIPQRCRGMHQPAMASTEDPTQRTAYQHPCWLTARSAVAADTAPPDTAVGVLLHHLRRYMTVYGRPERPRGSQTTQLLPSAKPAI